MAPSYRARVVEAEIRELLASLPAVAIEGAKGVGKTETALRHAATVHRLDDPEQMRIARADPARLLTGDRPVLLDEWQRLPELWDLVRRAVDDGAPPGSFLLTGSATPDPAAPMHSGAGRIVSVRMRPLTLAERGVAEPTVSLATLLAGGRPELRGATDVDLDTYTQAVLASGLPGLLRLAGRPLRAQLDGYIDRVVEHDFEELGHTVRRPARLRRWLAAYAAASATTATAATIRDAAGGREEPPARSTIDPWVDVLRRLWVLDPVPAWSTSRNHLGRLTLGDKHHLLDPALAARLIGVGHEALLQPADVGPRVPRDGTLLGALFESLVTLDLRVYAQAAEARLTHLRVRGGRHEVDCIVQRDDQRVVAVEVKLARSVHDEDVQHLRWLTEQLGDDLLDAIVVTTGPAAYRRDDGIGVVPAALLGP